MLARACTWVVGITLLSSSTAFAGPKLDVPAEVVDRVKAAVPEGWKVSADGDMLTVRRERPVSQIYTINMPPLVKKDLARYKKENAHESPYEITLRFAPRLDREARERLRAENERKGKALEAHREKLRGINHKFDDYLPATPEQERLVAAYRAAEKATPIEPLPSSFTETRSVYEISPSRDGWAFVDEKVGDECREVERKVAALFEPYDPK